MSTAPRPSSRRAGRPADRAKRAAILEAATRSFFDHGFAATSIEQVAADAGVSKVTVYNHFGDKRSLFAASVDRECDKMRGHFSISQAGEGTIRERLRTIGEAMVAFLARPEMIRFEHRIAAETESDPDLGRAFLEAGPWRMKTEFAAFLEHAAEAGELLIADPAIAAEQFVSMCKGMGDLDRRFGARPDPQESLQRIERAVDVFLAAYSPEESASL
ncbi:TetR/AcrR family transcriptional regulator [Erythrobacter sp.]|uniref:TetR/AcrR family transcriptional regulator n=1 Tax=Erythrobacter sp. TaxID=1042 RepID=UPI0025C40A83|nr:TetR/AcrR family transcriptional regulator [Erythrobacter sp.]